MKKKKKSQNKQINENQIFHIKSYFYSTIFLNNSFTLKYYYKFIKNIILLDIIKKKIKNNINFNIEFYIRTLIKCSNILYIYLQHNKKLTKFIPNNEKIPDEKIPDENYFHVNNVFLDYKNNKNYPYREYNYCIFFKIINLLMFFKIYSFYILNIILINTFF